jgi:predicted nucleic acid-binding Zn ribbon protein
MKSFTPVKDVIFQILKRKKLCEEIDFLKIFAEWEEIVGERLAMYAKPIRMRKNILYVEVKDPTYLSHMEYVKEKLIEKIINLVGKEIKDLRFVLPD